jgi:hypothetical protein
MKRNIFIFLNKKEIVIRNIGDFSGSFRIFNSDEKDEIVDLSEFLFKKDFYIWRRKIKLFKMMEK